MSIPTSPTFDGRCAPKQYEDFFSDAISNKNRITQNLNEGIENVEYQKFQHNWMIDTHSKNYPDKSISPLKFKLNSAEKKSLCSYLEPINCETDNKTNKFVIEVISEEEQSG